MITMPNDPAPTSLRLRSSSSWQELIEQINAFLNCDIYRMDYSGDIYKWSSNWQIWQRLGHSTTLYAHKFINIIATEHNWQISEEIIDNNNAEFTLTRIAS